MVKTKTPQRGEFWMLDLDPAVGTEMKKTRPVLVLSSIEYNKLLRLISFVPVTSTVDGPYKGLEVRVPYGAVTGAIRIDHVGTKSWVQREARKLGVAPKAVLEEVSAKLKAHLGLNED